MRFSVIVVSLNAGEELKKTVESVLAQKYADFEIVVKDGGSTDGSTDLLPADARIRLIVKKDRSIYDAMNQAVQEAKGEYFLFLNCGDYLYQETVLGSVAKAAAKEPADIYYGDLYRRQQDSVDAAPERITDFVCYRNVPCHQVCFYARHLFAKRAYDLQYPVRADYEHFLWCVYRAEARCRSLRITVADYQGSGFSETPEHLRQAALEHKKITKEYLGGKCLWYQALMWLTLQPLRAKLAQSRRFSGYYHSLKRALYR
ncbi:MAG: glycosyltransferase, partial [Lachnospiraceae bacterium]|nr:glycosyltransferase [Lachnospiraceae bacterium]